MKKFLSKIFSAALCSLVACANFFGVSAETVNVESKYPIHGNKCGCVALTSDIDREIYVNITQHSQDGDYEYYNVVIPEKTDETAEDEYIFTLEGKDDVSYSMKIGVPVFRGTDKINEYTYNFEIKNTDFFTDESIAGYIYSINISRDDNLSEPSVISEETLVNDSNMAETKLCIGFPASDITPGDVNLDGVKDLYDVIEIAKYVLDNSYLQGDRLSAAEYDGNGIVDIYDAIALATDLLKN